MKRATLRLESLMDVNEPSPSAGDYFRFDTVGWSGVGVGQVLTDLKTVDGSGSGLDADLLDGNEASAFALSSHEHAASDVTSGTFEDARISESSVTQHQGAIDHGSMAGLADDDHTQYLLADGSRAMAGNLDLDGNDINNVAAIGIGTSSNALVPLRVMASDSSIAWALTASDVAVIERNGAANFNLVTAADALGRFSIGDADARNRAWFDYDHSTEKMTLGAAGVEVASFDGTSSIIYDTPRFPNIISAAGAAALRVDADGYVSYQVSAEGYKQDISDYDPEADDLFALTAKVFRFKSEVAANPNARYLVGWMAEDVDEHCPSFCVYDAQGNPLNIDLDRMIVAVVEKMKAMQAAIDDLKARVEALEGSP